MATSNEPIHGQSTAAKDPSVRPLSVAALLNGSRYSLMRTRLPTKYGWLSFLSTPSQKAFYKYVVLNNWVIIPVNVLMIRCDSFQGNMALKVVPYRSRHLQPQLNPWQGSKNLLCSRPSSLKDNYGIFNKVFVLNRLWCINKWFPTLLLQGLSLSSSHLCLSYSVHLLILAVRKLHCQWLKRFTYIYVPNVGESCNLYVIITNHKKWLIHSNTHDMILHVFYVQ